MFQGIQALRGLAVLAVLIYHAGLPLPGGYLGVDIFFVISGFVITSSLIRELTQTGTISFKAFYKRRVKRLLPALLAVIAITTPALLSTASPLGASQNSIWTAMASVFGLGNLAIQYLSGGYFGADAKVNHFLHTWSLGIEEQFYLVLPVIALLSIRRSTTIKFKAFGLAIFAVFVVSLGIAFSTTIITLPLDVTGIWGFYSPITRAWELALGVLLAIVLDRLNSHLSSRTAGLVGLSMTAVALSIDWNLYSPLLGQLVATAGSALMIFSLTQDRTRILASGSVKFLSRVGDLSYSLYLWHWPLIVIAKSIWPTSNFAWFMTAALAVIPAALSYRFIESPLRKKRWRLDGKRPLLVLFASATFVVGGSWLALTQGFWNPVVLANQTAVMQDHAPAKKSWLCALGGLTVENIEICSWNPKGSGKPIYLVGDSQAGQLAEAVIEAGSELGRPVVISSIAGCGLFFSTSQSDQCNSFAQRSIELLTEVEPGDVVVAFAQTNPGIISVDKRKTTDMYRKISERHDSIVLVKGIPMYGSEGEQEFNPLHCPLSSIIQNSCHATMTRDSFEKQREPMLRLFASLWRSETGINTLEIATMFCDADVCSTSLKGLIGYKDESHISVQASRNLTPLFLSALSRR